MKYVVTLSAFIALLMIAAVPVYACPCEPVYGLIQGMDNSISESAKQSEGKQDQGAIDSDAQGQVQTEDPQRESRSDRTTAGAAEPGR